MGKELGAGGETLQVEVKLAKGTSGLKAVRAPTSGHCAEPQTWVGAGGQLANLRVQVGVTRFQPFPQLWKLVLGPRTALCFSQETPYAL